MAKIVPFGKGFSNLKAMLAALAEDEHAIGFVGCILRNENDGRGIALRRAHFGANLADVALASLMLGQMAVEDDDD